MQTVTLGPGLKLAQVQLAYRIFPLEAQECIDEPSNQISTHPTVRSQCVIFLCNF